MATPRDSHDPPRDPLKQIYGYEEWAGWWHFPVVLTIATTVVVVAAILIQGPGIDGSTTFGELSRVAAERGTPSP